MIRAQLDRWNRRAILLSRAWREVFWLAAPKRWLLGRVWRWLLLAEDGSTRRRAGDHVLADLRDFSGLGAKRRWQADPLMMARQAGRAEVVLRILGFLNLDETQVQQLMEIDDGVE